MTAAKGGVAVARTVRRAGLAAALALLLAGCATTGPRPAAAPAGGPPVEERFGIRFESLRLASAGWFLDLRYRVIDPGKAARIVRPGMEATLLDPRSGARLVVPSPPKVGRLRQAPRELEAQRVYFLMFVNEGRALAPGDRVTVSMGELNETLTVQ